MLRVKIHPSIDYLNAFLQTRGFLLVDDKPNILHYTGNSIKELKSLLKKDKPDLVILHSQIFYRNLPSGVFWVYHPFNTEKQMYATKKIYTNNYRICQLYYQRLGRQAEILVIPSKKKSGDDKAKHGFKFDKLKRLGLCISKAMFWK